MRQVPKKIVLLLCIKFIFAPSLFANCATNFSNNYKLHGQRYHYGKITLLNLHGTYCNMGHEYGYLEKHNLQKFYQQLHYLLVVQKKYDYKTLLVLANKVYQHYPERYKNLLKGMSQTSGLSLQQHIFLNAFEYVLYCKRFKQPGCAAIAVWDHYTKNSKLLFGRNYDYFSGYPQFKRLLTVAVFHPKHIHSAVAMITFFRHSKCNHEYEQSWFILRIK